MKDNTYFSILIIIAISIITTAIIMHDVYAQTSKEDLNKTLSITDNRKSFGYCPSNDDSKNILDSLGISYSIEGCPLSRIYIENWDKISDTDKQLIADYLLSKGYRIENE